MHIIETNFSIKLPLIYKKLENDGMLQYADFFGSDWYKNVYPTLKNQPPFLLFAQNFELLSLRDVFDEMCNMREMTDEYPYNHLHESFTMIPFAGDGSGDRYAFYNAGEQYGCKPNELSIIHWWHDGNHCDVKAKNLQDFIFIKMLDLALKFESEYDLAADGDAKNNCNHLFNTHEKYLTESQTAVLKQVYNREWVEDDDGNLSTITSQEYNRILMQEIGYTEDLGKFIYTNG